MQQPPATRADSVRQVFLVPPDFSTIAASLIEQSERLAEPQKAIALAFLDNLKGVLRILGLPFQLTHSKVHNLHWQRLWIANKIGSGGDYAVALINARAEFQQFLAAEGKTIVQDDVLKSLAELALEPESLATARELTRQGVVLIWSAFEVLSRDLFILLLNSHPSWTDRLLAQPGTKKRFTVEKLDWQTLGAFSFDLSSSVGTLLAQRADLDDIQTIRETFEALFPAAPEMNQSLADVRLWFLFQKRNLIVHRRGIVDSHYRDKTGDTLSIGTQLVVPPSDIEDLLVAVLSAGGAIVQQAANNG